MRISAWVVAASLVSISWVAGCGNITQVDGGMAGSRGGGTAGAAGSGSGGSGSGGTAGTGGGRAGTVGTGGGNAGTIGSGGSAAGGRGGGNAGSAGSAGSAGTTGSGGSAAGGRGGSDGTGTGGRGGNAGTTGTVGTGGVATGGRGGGGAGTGGIGTGGVVTTGGRGGGAGGVTTGGRGGGNAGTGGAAGCARGMCPALSIGDLEAIDDSKAPGFDATGFRCKSLTICQNASACIYYSTDMLGSLQSADDVYNDGAELTPAPVKLSINIGSASQCNNPPITFTVDEYLTLTFDGGKKVPVYLPMSMGTTLTLYIASDGSTFLDAALTMPARLRP